MSGVAIDVVLRRATCLLLSFVLVIWGRTAFAYRPFDGADASVTEPGEFQIEVGPVQPLQAGSERLLVAPALGFSYGIARDWELGWHSDVAHERFGERRTRIMGNAVTLKRLLREGSLQDDAGPSMATEFGLLLPGVNDEYGTGAIARGVVSQQWQYLTVHVTAAATISREHNRDLFVSTILEGPNAWRVRPVMEVLHEQETAVGHTTSLLIGAIWRVRETLSFDFGLREASIPDQRQREVRAGFTYSWSSQ